MSFQKILEKYRQISFSERDKGGRFERLMQAYLKTDPKYAFRFKNVWMWNEFPGKTFNSLRIAEHETDGNGLILFLVPSIALLGQTLREWSADANEPINAVCICSDPDISKKKTRKEDTDTFSVVDLALPASTDTANILHQFRQIKQKGLPGMTVVFSTYQSIDVIARAQKELLKQGFSEFDLVICDEAHRTTGVTLSGEDESAFMSSELLAD